MIVAYFWGLATLPALALLYVLVVLLAHGPGDEWQECRHCWYKRRPEWRPWWLWIIYRRREWRQHMQLSHTCRQRINSRNARTGADWRYDERGRKQTVT